VKLEGLGQLKIPMISSGTFLLVAYSLNKLSVLKYLAVL
jgi:hypothetical protein